MFARRIGDVPPTANRPLWRGAVVILFLIVSGAVFERPAPAAQSSGASASCSIETTQRIVAVGDVHGAFDKFVAILREAGIIDNRRRWTGGRAILVQTGDVVDRGPDSREVIDLLRKLEGEAERAGGRVHTLLGNHEVMRLFNQRRYISAGEFEEFRTLDSEELRERAYELLRNENAQKARTDKVEFDERAFRKAFLADNPLGSVEMQIAFSPQGEYGRWVRGNDLMVKINGILFLHGGISPATATLGCTAINAMARAEIKGANPPVDQDKSITTGADGPLWYRGLADGNSGVGVAEVDAILKAMDAKLMVIGHTQPADFKIRAALDGRVVMIDTGMLGGDYFKGGVPSALEINGDTLTAIYEGRREVLRPAGLSTALRDR